MWELPSFIHSFLFVTQISALFLVCVLFVVVTLIFDLVLFLFGFLWRRRHGITAPDVIDLAELCETDHEATEAPTTLLAQRGVQKGAPGARLPQWVGNLQRVRLKVTITFTPHPTPYPKHCSWRQNPYFTVSLSCRSTTLPSILQVLYRETHLYLTHRSSWIAYSKTESTIKSMYIYFFQSRSDIIGPLKIRLLLSLLTLWCWSKWRFCLFLPLWLW